MCFIMNKTLFFFLISIIYCIDIPKISVIIPIYNTQKYLRKCLDSVINQTLKEIEIICINDASTDSSKKILEEYSLKDKRIKIINNERNLGQSLTRNKGLDIAKGEFIGFVDSDDYIEPQTYEISYINAKNDNVDIVKFNEIIFKDKSDKGYLNENNLNVTGKIYNIKKCWRNFSNVIWNKIIKNSIIKKHNLRFIEGLYGEDFCFLKMLYPFINKVKIISPKFYHYRRRRKQLSRISMNKKWEKIKPMFYILPKFWKDNNLIKGNEKFLFELLLDIYTGRGRDKLKRVNEFYNMIKNETDLFNKKNINNLDEYFKQEVIYLINNNTNNSNIEDL